VLSLATSPQMTAAEQWFERTLDDSANKRVSIPELFLATEGMLRLVHNVAGGMVVYPKVIAARVAAELPFIATENIMMAAARAGWDRQDAHERIRKHSQAAAAEVKLHGRANDLIERLRGDEAFAKVDLESVLDAKTYIGRAAEQVDAFVKEYVAPVRRRCAGALGVESRLDV
jgi:adenylosuccinate lyase